MTSNAGPVLCVLAAGASRRLGQPKALVRFGARSVLEHLLAAGSGCRDRLVVTGAHDAEIRRALLESEHSGSEDLHVVTNAAWSQGRSGSIGAAHAARPARDLLIAPVDVPLVSSAVFEALCASWTAAGEPARGFLAPFVRGSDGPPRHGHPIVLGRELAREVASAPPDRPLRELRDTAEPRFDVAVADRAILDDLDSPDDLEILRRRVASS